jgi:AraC family transcriptional regulator, dual regulator of chb operon
MLLRFRKYAPNDEAYHVGRRAPPGPFRGVLHTHDFAEVMWIEHGALTHLVNGARESLATGDVVFIRATDVHTFTGEGYAQVNVAFPPDTLDFLEHRYFADGRWPWRAGELPAVYRLDRHQLARMTELSRLLAEAEATRLLLERFLLELLHVAVEPAAMRAVPQWLRDALERLAGDPGALAGGVPALARLAGRSREHVNRVARATTGSTATELVNETRLTRAAAELTMTDEPIARIAAGCGLPNLSHFYRLFNARFGVTPRQLRLRHRTLL